MGVLEVYYYERVVSTVWSKKVAVSYIPYGTTELILDSASGEPCKYSRTVGRWDLKVELALDLFKVHKLCLRQSWEF